jgi:hypothetical protein
MKSFEACSVFTTRYGLTTRRTAFRYVCLEGSDGFVTSTAAPIASGWSDQTWPGGICTHWDAVPYHGARLFKDLKPFVHDGLRRGKLAAVADDGTSDQITLDEVERIAT